MLAGERRAFQTHAVCFGSLLVSAVPWLICLFPMLVLEMGWSSHLELRHPILSSWFCLWSQSPWRLQPLRPDCSVPLLLHLWTPAPEQVGAPGLLCALPRPWEPGAPPGSFLYQCYPLFPCYLAWGPAYGLPGFLKGTLIMNPTKISCTSPYLFVWMSSCLLLPEFHLRGQGKSWAFDLSSHIPLGFGRGRLSIFSSLDIIFSSFQRWHLLSPPLAP